MEDVLNAELKKRRSNLQTNYVFDNLFASSFAFRMQSLILTPRYDEPINDNGKLVSFKWLSIADKCL